MKRPLCPRHRESATAAAQCLVRDNVEMQLARLRRALEDGWVCEACDDPTCPPGTRKPLARGLRETDYEFTVEDFVGEACVVLEFSHDEAHGVRFKHRFPPSSITGDSDYSDVFFMENVETNKLTRSRARVGPEARTLWTDFSWGHPANRIGWVMDLLRERRFAEAAAVLRWPDAHEWDLQLAHEIEAVVVAGTPTSADIQFLIDHCRQEHERRRELDQQMTSAFWERHVRPRA